MQVCSAFLFGHRCAGPAAKASDHWKSPLGESKDGKLRGRGIANGYWFNIGLKSAVTISVNEDGTVALTEGSTDIGG
ncbi:MAG: hypothetical protein IIC12_08100, partial [Proteobacteria bacterium]|nr:hypothetical protein [Pseudomonadota bacterium]